jgi:hypothetical protein
VNGSPCHCMNGYTGSRCEIAPGKNFTWIIVDVILLAVILAAYKVYSVVRDRRRKQRSQMIKSNDYLKKFEKDAVVELEVVETSPLLKNKKFLIDIEFRDVVLQHKSKTILSNVTGHFRPGRLAAIMVMNTCNVSE